MNSQILENQLIEDYCDHGKYPFYFGQRYKVGCRKHCHCYCTAKQWTEAKRVAKMISKMDNHKGCLIDIHDGQTGLKIGFVNGMMGLIASYKIVFR